MEQATIIGIDLAKRVFQAHGAAADGSVVFRKKLSRGQLLSFLAAQPRCTVAMEACATAHGWGREIGRLYLEQIDMLSGRIDALGKKLRAEAGQAAATRRLQTMPGVGPITAPDHGARSRRLPSKASTRRWRPSAGGGTSRPGSGWSRARTRQAASRGSDERRRCKFAIVVSDDAQGKGIGSRLMTSLTQAARGQGLSAIEGIVLADNKPMLHLMRDPGFSARQSTEDRSLVVVDRQI
jgi:GNAT superfamily N-acetyltransferase